MNTEETMPLRSVEASDAALSLALPELASSTRRPSHRDEAIDEEMSFTDAQLLVFVHKHDIMLESRENFELEKDIRCYDARIGLLINHRLTFEEFVQRYKTSRGDRRGSGSDPRLRGPLLQHYGCLMYILQTEPDLVAKLIWVTSQYSTDTSKADNLMKVIMSTIYGNHFEQRDEHLLLCMFEHALKFEFEESEDVNGLLRHNSGVTRMMTMYTQRGPGVEYLHHVLSESVQKIAAIGESLEVHPVKIYHDLVQEGVAEQIPALQEAQALENERVRQIIAERVPRLEELTGELLQTIISSVDAVPYAIRWLCNLIQSLIEQYFPETAKDTICSLIGGFFFLRYVNPNIIAPEKSGVMCTAPKPSSRRTLTLVAKILQNVANKPKKLKEVYMQRFNDFVARNQSQLKQFIFELAKVPGFHDTMEVEHLMAFSKGDISLEMMVSEITLIHSVLEEYSSDLKSLGNSARLFEILQDIGPAQNLCSAGDYKVVLKVFSRWGNVPKSVSPSSEEQVDKEQSAKHRCQVLVEQLFNLLPNIIDTSSLAEGMRRARECNTEYVAERVQSAVDNLEMSLRQLSCQEEGEQIFADVKKVSPSTEELRKEYLKELRNLKNIAFIVSSRNDWLFAQLNLYKDYLAAVRAKAASEQGRSFLQGKTHCPVRLGLSQLLKDGVATPESTVNGFRHKDVTLVFTSPSPGAYDINVVCQGEDHDSRRFQLEDLLELQGYPDLRLNVGESISLDAPAALLLISKLFIRH